MDQWQKLIADMIKNIEQRIEENNKENQKYREKSLEWKYNTSHRLEAIEKDLREHKEGVIQNRRALKEVNNKITEIETPAKSRAYIYKTIITTGKVVGGLITIFGIFKLFSLW